MIRIHPSSALYINLAGISPDYNAFEMSCDGKFDQDHNHGAVILEVRFAEKGSLKFSWKNYLWVWWDDQQGPFGDPRSQ